MMACSLVSSVLLAFCRRSSQALLCVSFTAWLCLQGSFVVLVFLILNSFLVSTSVAMSWPQIVPVCLSSLSLEDLHWSADPFCPWVNMCLPRAANTPFFLVVDGVWFPPRAGLCALPLSWTPPPFPLSLPLIPMADSGHLNGSRWCGLIASVDHGFFRWTFRQICHGHSVMAFCKDHSFRSTPTRN